METERKSTSENLIPENVDLAAVTGKASPKGRVEIYNLGNFRLHVYYSRDVMNDASYIIEGTDGLVTMEEPLFVVNVAEFNEYLNTLGKPVVKRITDYHLGGTGSHTILMAEGMPQFMRGPVYSGMMKGFEKAFGDTMTKLPTGKEEEVAFGVTEVFAGVTFEFRHGATSDFPAASIIIGGKVYYTHWTPLKAHMSHLQLSSRAAVDAELAEAHKELKSGAVLFIGGHGGASGRDSVEFKIDYLNEIKKILAEAKTPEEFIDHLKKTYPGLPGEAGLKDLAIALYR